MIRGRDNRLDCLTVRLGGGLAQDRYETQRIMWEIVPEVIFSLPGITQTPLYPNNVTNTVNMSVDASYPVIMDRGIFRNDISSSYYSDVYKGSTIRAPGLMFWGNSRVISFLMSVILDISNNSERVIGPFQDVDGLGGLGLKLPILFPHVYTASEAARQGWAPYEGAAGWEQFYVNVPRGGGGFNVIGTNVRGWRSDVVRRLEDRQI